MVQQIDLSQGLVALVDDEDYELVAPLRWTVLKQRRRSGFRYYARHNHRSAGRQRTILMHRLIIGALPGEEVDHRDGDGLNNRRFNIRKATPSQNQVNRDFPGGAVPFRGVQWNDKDCRYETYIATNGVRIFVGQYRSAIEAAVAYDAAAIQHHGDFARLNFGDIAAIRAAVSTSAGAGCTAGPGSTARGRR